MKTLSNRLLVGGVAIMLLLGVGVAYAADGAAQAYAEGQKLLTQGDFAGAIEAFGTAAKNDRSNAQYRAAYMVLRKVIRMRESLASETNAGKRQAIATALRAFYYDNSVFAEALPLDREAYEKAKTPETALNLADSLLATGNDGEAAKILAAHPDPSNGAWLTAQALAAARQGQAKQANEFLSKAAAAQGEAAEPWPMFQAAQARMLLKDNAGAMAELKSAFEMTAPSRQPVLRNIVSHADEFASVTKDPAFVAVLDTPSKIEQSSCSGGSSCGSCQLKGSCSSSASTGCSQ